LTAEQEIEGLVKVAGRTIGPKIAKSENAQGDEATGAQKT
jgi:hypothetical protein